MDSVITQFAYVQLMFPNFVRGDEIPSRSRVQVWAAFCEPESSIQLIKPKKSQNNYLEIDKTKLRTISLQFFKSYSFHSSPGESDTIRDKQQEHIGSQ